MLYVNEFDKLWNCIIQNSIVKFAEQLNIKCKPLFFLKFALKNRYNKYKDSVVKTFMSMDTTNIDRHKIASCILKSILVTKPIYIPIHTKLKFVFSKKELYEVLGLNPKNEQEKKLARKRLLFLNEYLAINIAIFILESYINSDKRETRFKHEILPPNPFPEADIDYLLDVCIGLHFSNKKYLDPIVFSNVLFLWEKYSCRKKQCDNLESAYKDLLMKDTDKSDEEIKIMVDNALYGLPNN